MKIFEPLVSEGYEWINTIDGKDYEVFNTLDGALLSSSWIPVKIRRVTTDEGKKFVPSDFPWLGGPLIMRWKAIDALRDMLLAHGEILPLETDDGIELFVFNCRVVDALDEANSTIWRFPSSGRIMRIKDVSFIQSKIEGLDMFRLPLRSSATYVSENFVKQYKKAGLVGLEFNKP